MSDQLKVEVSADYILSLTVDMTSSRGQTEGYEAFGKFPGHSQRR